MTCAHIVLWRSSSRRAISLRRFVEPKKSDERMDDLLGLDADRLHVKPPFSKERGRSRSPPPVGRAGTEGGTSQNRNEKNGESRWMFEMCFTGWIFMEHGEALFQRFQEII